MPINHLPYSKTLNPLFVGEGSKWLINSSIYENVHFRNSNSGNTSMQIDSIQVYGEKTANYLSCTGDSVGYRFGFNGKEKVDEVYGDANAYDFGARLYDPRLGRWLSIDPINKAVESPYIAFGNNPIWYVDKEGMDTLVVHAEVLKEDNQGGTTIIKITFSVIQNGIETPVNLKIKTPDGEIETNHAYFTVPKEYWTGGNRWVPPSGDVKYVPIRFESYESSGSGRVYDNAIRLKYADSKGNRILAHFGKDGGWSVGCDIPTLKIPTDGNISFKTQYSQEILDGIRELFNQYVKSTETIDKYGRTVQTPNDGDDFMVKTNSSAPKSNEQKKENSSENE